MIGRDIKFRCEIGDGECIIPLDTDDDELTKNGLPHNCMECDYYQCGEITFKEYKNIYLSSK